MGKRTSSGADIVISFGTLPLNQKFEYTYGTNLEIIGRDLDGLRVDDTVETNARMTFGVGGGAELGIALGPSQDSRHKNPSPRYPAGNGLSAGQ